MNNIESVRTVLENKDKNGNAWHLRPRESFRIHRKLYSLIRQLSSTGIMSLMNLISTCGEQLLLIMVVIVISGCNK